jgi:hypothetical protein
MLINSYRFGIPWTPAQITTALWLDAADASTVTQSSGLISQVNDKSGNGRNFTASGTARPTYTPGALNGRAELTFGGTQWLTSESSAVTWTFLHDSTGSSIFAIWKPGITSDPNTFYGLIGTCAGSSGNVGIFLSYDDRASVPRNNKLIAFVARGGGMTPISAFTADNFATPNTYQIAGCVLNPSAAASSRSSIRVNGGTASETNAETATAVDTAPTFALQVGALGNNVGPLTGGLTELVIVSGITTTDTRQRIEGYLAHKWNLAANLPADHPYKSVAPTV